MPKEPERLMIKDIWENKCEFYKEFGDNDDEEEDYYDCYAECRRAGVKDNRCNNCEDGIYQPDEISLIDILNKYRNYDVNELKIDANEYFIQIVRPEPIEEFDARVRDYHDEMLEYDKKMRAWEEYNLPQNKALRDEEERIKKEHIKTKILAQAEEKKQKKIRELEEQLAKLKNEKEETKRATKKKGAKK